MWCLEGIRWIFFFFLRKKEKEKREGEERNESFLGKPGGSSVK